jgi:hypothetical protein
MTAEGEVPWGGFWTKTWLDTALLLGGRTNPSPGPPRLKKAPAAGHPLPRGEGCHFEGRWGAGPLPKGEGCYSQAVRTGSRFQLIQNLKSEITPSP